MKAATALSIAVILASFVGHAQAEEILFSCMVSSQDTAKQKLIVKIKDGHVSYGADMASLVGADSIIKGSLAIDGGHIAFKQTWARSHVEWDWNIDRGAGAISIKYVNTENKKTYLNKKGSCVGV
jgi:hypothetical protein